jgi:hypothetical protein
MYKIITTFTLLYLLVIAFFLNPTGNDVVTYFFITLSLGLLTGTFVSFQKNADATLVEFKLGRFFITLIISIIMAAAVFLILFLKTPFDMT